MARKTRRRAKLPPGVARVRLKDGTFRFRAWIPLGAAGSKKWTRLVDDPETAYRQRCDILKLDKELPKDDLTLQQAVDRTMERLKTTRRAGTVHWFRSCEKVILDYFGPNTVLATITTRDIEAFRDAKIRAKVLPRSKKSKPSDRRLSASTIGHYRRALSMIFNGCRRFLHKNPMDDVDGWPTVEQKEMTFFSAEQVAQVLHRIRASGLPRANEDADLVGLLFLTGWRRSEIARLTVEQIDFERKVAWITGKTENEKVSLAPETVAVLKRMVARVGQGPIIPLGPEHVGGVFKKWARLLGEKGLRPHAMRHSFVTQLVRSGLSMPVVQRLSRHRTLSMVARYFHGTEDDAAALSAVSLKGNGAAQASSA